jgi:bifunctional DNase/RNase
VSPTKASAGSIIRAAGEGLLVARVALIDASTDNTPLGLLIISGADGEEIRQSCHPVDAIAMAARTHIPLYATSRALKMGSWKNIRPWLKTVKPQDFE